MARKTKEPLEKQSFEALMQRLEEVVGRLEGSQLSLEESLDALEEGMALARAGEARLLDAEKRVEVLLSSPDAKAAPRAVPLDAIGAAAAETSGGTEAASGETTVSGGGVSHD